MEIIIDRQGKIIRKGDTVLLVDIPLELFLGITESEQRTLRAEIGKIHLIQNTNRHGSLELEFFDAKGISHTVFIRPSCVTRIPR